MPDWLGGGLFIEFGIGYVAVLRKNPTESACLIKGSLVEKLPSYRVLTPPHRTTSRTSHITNHSHH